MTVCDSDRPYDFYSHRPLVVRFSDLELSSDAGILLARQAEQQTRVCQVIAECIQEWRDPNKITHSLPQLVSQRVYQIVGGTKMPTIVTTCDMTQFTKLPVGVCPYRV